MTNQAKKNPGALAGATGAIFKKETNKLPEHITSERIGFTTFYWDRSSGSVELLQTSAGGVTI